MSRFDRTATSYLNLVLTHDVSVNIVRLVSASNQLNSTGSTVVNHKLVEVEAQLLNLTTEIVLSSPFHLPASNNLELTQVVIVDGTKRVVVEDVLTLTAAARSALIGRSVGHAFNLQQSIDLCGPINISVLSELSASQADLIELSPEERIEYASTIGLRQEVSLRRATYNLNAISYFSLSQQAAKTEVGTANNHIHLSHTCRPVLYEMPIDYLHFIQEASCYNGQGPENILELEQDVLVTGVLLKSATNQLTLQSVCTYFMINFCDYTPGIGAGVFDYTPPSTIIPTLVRRTTTILTWPYSAPTLTLELHNPNFDNVEQFSFQRINRRTLGGTLDLYRDEDWPKVQKLIYNFSALSEIQRVELLTFLIRSIGQEVGLLDFESRQWRGIIITPSSEISQPVREYGFNVSLEFEGVLV